MTQLLMKSLDAVYLVKSSLADATVVICHRVVVNFFWVLACEGVGESFQTRCELPRRRWPDEIDSGVEDKRVRSWPLRVHDCLLLVSGCALEYTHSFFPLQLTDCVADLFDHHFVRLNRVRLTQVFSPPLYF